MHYGFGVSYGLLWLLVVFHALLIVALLRQLVELRSLVETGSDVLSDPVARRGAKAPRFTTTDARSGRRLSLDTFAGRRGVLLFLSSGCRTCLRLASSLKDLSDEPTKLIVVCKDQAIVSELSPRVLCAVDGVTEIAAQYGIAGLPAAVVIDEAQTVVDLVHPRTGTDIARLLGLLESPEPSMSKSTPGTPAMEVT